MKKKLENVASLETQLDFAIHSKQNAVLCLFMTSLVGCNDL